MENLFCAEQSRQSGVDIVGTASEHQVYVHQVYVAIALSEALLLC